MVQFREISSRVKSPNFGYRAYRAHCVIGHVGVQLGWFHSYKNYSKAFGGIPMLLVQLLEPKWCFIYITGTHAGQGDDSAGEQD